MASLSSGARLGNSSVSSLVRSSQGLQAQINTYNDTVARLTFENSAKTADDLAAYTDHLSSRIGTLEATGNITDQTKALDLRQTMTSAIHSSASADIQRSTIAVLDGQGTPDDKLAAIGTAFQKLYSLGDLSAAQSYEQQYYSYYQTVQLQKQQAADTLATAAKSYSSNYSSAVTAAEDAIKLNISNANAAFSAQGPKFLDDQSNAYLKSQVDATGSKANGSASIFAALGGQVGMVKQGIQLNDNTKYAQGTYTPGSMLDIYTQSIIADPTNAAKYQSKIDGYLNGSTTVQLPGEGNKSLTYNALMNTIYAGNSGNAPYGVTQNADGSFQVAAEHVSGYTFGQDQNGNMKLMPAYSFFTAGLPNDTKDALTKAGINVKQDGNGDWFFQATNQASFLAKAIGNYPTQGAVQKDGSVEFTGNGKLYKLVQGQNGLHGLQEINQFGQVVNPNVAGQYGFVPPKDQTLVNKGSTDFMTKVLGQSATPQIIDNKVIYVGQNGKAYQLATDTRGLKGLQEIDKNGNVVNNNVAGQYGFNPNSVTRNGNGNTDHLDRGTAFASSLVDAHNKYMNGLKAANDPNFKNPDGIHALSPGWLGVSNIINNAQMMQSINMAHNTAMLALAPPVALPHINLPVPQAPAPIPMAAPAPSPRLQVAATANQIQPTYNPQPATVNPQPQSGIKLQGGGVNGFNLNTSGGGWSMKL